MRQVQDIGTLDAGSTWVHVGDRGADMFPFFHACQMWVRIRLLSRGDLREKWSEEQASQEPASEAEPLPLPYTAGTDGQNMVGAMALPRSLCQKLTHIHECGATLPLLLL